MKKTNLKNSLKNKHGFTIVELLIVIVVIGILAVITIISYSGVTVKARTARAQSNANAVLKVLELMYVDNGAYPSNILSTVPSSTTAKIPSSVNLSVNNPTSLNGENTVSYEICGSSYPATSATVLGGRIGYYDFGSAQVKYVYVGSGIESPSGSTPKCLTAYTGAAPTYPNATVVYLNPETGVLCSSAQAVSTTGTKTGCMKWYAYNDGGSYADKINLILDHNTTATVAWNTTGSAAGGPTTILSQLQSDTSTWSGIQTRTDSYSYNGTVSYNVNYSGYKARLITAAEVAKMSNNTTFNEATTTNANYFFLDNNTQTASYTTTGTSKFKWMFNYTKFCTSYGCDVEDSNTYGYWTATAVSGLTDSGWLIYSAGSLDDNTVSTPHGLGLRPVITISKSLMP